jgi:hypothetical protein
MEGKEGAGVTRAVRENVTTVARSAIYSANAPRPTQDATKSTGSGIESPYDGMDLDMESADQGIVHVANTCGGFGSWEHEPYLDLGEDEGEYTVMAANAMGPQLLDAYGAR